MSAYYEQDGTAQDDVRTVCEIAFEWAGEYGFAIPDRARKVWEAAARLCPDVEPVRKGGGI